MAVRLTAAETGIRAGWQADDIIKAIEANDIGLLVGKHTGLFSIQLQAPGGIKMPVGEVPGELPVGGSPGQTKPETIPAGDTSTKPLATGNTKPVAPSTKPTNGAKPPVGSKP